MIGAVTALFCRICGGGDLGGSAPCFLGEIADNADDGAVRVLGLLVERLAELVRLAAGGLLSGGRASVSFLRASGLQE